MKTNDILHLLAGAFIMTSVSLVYFVNPWWFAFTFFVGANLFQSGLTKWCFMAVVLCRMGIRKQADRTRNAFSSSKIEMSDTVRPFVASFMRL